MLSFNYYLEFKGFCKPVLRISLLSLALLLTFQASAQFTHQATSPTYYRTCTGQTHTHAVAVIGSPVFPLTYTWKRNGAVVSTASGLDSLNSFITALNSGGNYCVTVKDANDSVSNEICFQSVFVAPPTVSTLSAPASLCAGATGTLTFRINNFRLGHDYTYVLYRNGTMFAQDSLFAVVGGQETKSYNVPAGNYNFVAHNRYLGVTCTGNRIQNISELPQAVLSLNSALPNRLCAGDFTGDSINATASGGTAPYTFEWKKGTTVVGTGSTLNITQGGTYCATVTGQSCPVTPACHSVTVVGEPTIVLNTSAGQMCNGDSVALTAQINNFRLGHDYTYVWKLNGTPIRTDILPAVTAGQNVSVFKATQAGTYTFEAMDSYAGVTCSAVKVFIITEKATPTITIQSSVPNRVCAGDFTGGSITATATGGTVPYAFDWKKGTAVVGTASTLNITQVGTYCATITGQTCPITPVCHEIMEVEKPEIVFGDSVYEFFFNDTLILSAQIFNIQTGHNYRYTWLQNDSVLSDTIVSQVITPQQTFLLNVTRPGNYIFRVSDTVSGYQCLSEKEVKVVFADRRFDNRLLVQVNKNNLFSYSKNPLTVNPYYDSIFAEYNVYKFEPLIDDPELDDDTLIGNIFILECNTCDEKLLKEVLSQEIGFNKIIKSVDFDPIGTVTGCTNPVVVNDPIPNLNFQNYTNLPCAWAITTGVGSKIGILDENGYTNQHIDLIPNIVYGKDIMPLVGAYQDRNHGVRVSSVAAAKGNNGLGVVGVAYNSDLYLYDNPQISFVKVFYLAVKSKLDVINMSFMFASSSIIVKNVYKYTIQNGVSLVYGAGNESSIVNSGCFQHPDIICVTSTNENGDVTPSWAKDERVDISAMGGQFYQCNEVQGPEEYRYVITQQGSFTSFSAPVISGVIALMKSVNPDLRPYEVKCILKSTANPDILSRPINAPFAGKIGAGRVDAYEAVKKAQEMIVPSVIKNGEIYVWNSCMMRTLFKDIVIEDGGLMIVESGASLFIPSGKSITRIGSGELRIESRALFCEGDENDIPSIIANGQTYTWDQCKYPTLDKDIVIENGGLLKVISGGSLHLTSDRKITVKGAGEIRVEPGAYFCVENGAKIYLIDAESKFSLATNYTNGINSLRWPSVSSSTSCFDRCNIAAWIIDQRSKGQISVPDQEFSILPARNFFCKNETVSTSLVGTGYVYQWKKNGVNIPGATASSFSVVDNGAYTLSVKVEGNGINSVVDKCIRVSTSAPSFNVDYCPAVTGQLGEVYASLNNSNCGSELYIFNFYKNNLLTHSQEQVLCYDQGKMVAKFDITDDGAVYQMEVLNKYYCPSPLQLLNYIPGVSSKEITLQNSSDCENTGLKLILDQRCFPGVQYLYSKPPVEKGFKGDLFGITITNKQIGLDIKAGDIIYITGLDGDNNYPEILDRSLLIGKALKVTSTYQDKLTLDEGYGSFNGRIEFIVGRKLNPGQTLVDELMFASSGKYDMGNIYRTNISKEVMVEFDKTRIVSVENPLECGKETINIDRYCNATGTQYLFRKPLDASIGYRGALERTGVNSEDSYVLSIGNLSDIKKNDIIYITGVGNNNGPGPNLREAFIGSAFQVDDINADGSYVLSVLTKLGILIPGPVDFIVGRKLTGNQTSVGNIIYSGRYDIGNVNRTPTKLSNEITVTVNPCGLKFDGVDDYVTVPALSFTNALNNSTQLTLEARVILESQSGYPEFIRIAGNNPISFGYNKNANELYLSYDLSNTYVSAPVTLGECSHVAVTENNGTVIFYVDGIAHPAVHQMTSRYEIGAGPMIFGGSTGNHFKGTLSNIRIWNTVRTQEQINGFKDKSLFAAETGLLAYYQFLERGEPSTISTVNSANNVANLGITGDLEDFIEPSWFNVLNCNNVARKGEIEEELISANQILLYPNPFSDGFNLEVYDTQSETYSFEVYNLQGMKVMERRELTVGLIYTEPAFSLPSGLYLVKVQTSSKVETLRLIKLR